MDKNWHGGKYGSPALLYNLVYILGPNSISKKYYAGKKYLPNPSGVNFGFQKAVLFKTKLIYDACTIGFKHRIC